MRWVCIRNTNGRDCKWVLARRLGRIVRGRVDSWGGYQQWIDAKIVYASSEAIIPRCLKDPAPSI
jgi:hypothetical protein